MSDTQSQEADYENKEIKQIDLGILLAALIILNEDEEN